MSQGHGIISAIIRAKAHLRLHQDKRCCQDRGIFSSIFSKFNILIGRYTLIALANATIIIVINIGNINLVKFISMWERINHISMKTSEFATNAKNSQNFSICFSTFGLILYLP